MAKFEVKSNPIAVASEEGAETPVYEAEGTIDGTEFMARTIMYGPKGDKKPIFKVVEGEQLAKSLSTSEFSRGQRIAIARHLKAELEKMLGVDEEVAEAVEADQEN